MTSLKTELCLGLPGGAAEVDQSVKINGKRGFSETVDLKLNLHQNDHPALDLTQKPKTLSTTDSLIKPPAKYVYFFRNFNISRIFISLYKHLITCTSSLMFDLFTEH